MTALVVGLGTALVAALMFLAIALAAAAPRGMAVAEMLRVYPNLLRLLVSLSKDKQVARPVRWRLVIAVAYNAQPFNLIPDFIPVIGLADNAIITAWAVRSAVRKSGPEVVVNNWRGSDASFAVLCRLCRLPIDQRPRCDAEVEQTPEVSGSSLGRRT